MYSPIMTQPRRFFKVDLLSRISAAGTIVSCMQMGSNSFSSGCSWQYKTAKAIRRTANVFQDSPFSVERSLQ